MTTTKTKVDPAVQVAATQEQLEAAREERARLGAEAQSWQEGVAKLEHDLSELARGEPDQFANGFPRAKTRAAKLQAEIDKLRTGHKWAEILGGADQRIRQLEAQLSKVTAVSADELARREYLGKGKDAVEKLRKAVTLIHEGAADYLASTGQQTQIAHSCDGLDGRDVWSDPVVNEARRLADRLAQVQPPRPVSLVPLTSEEPPRVRSHSGGYIGANVSLNNAAEDQPERVEPV